MKVLFIAVGSISVLLAIIGLFVPLLPTTPFLILASACYLRSSEHLHQRLTHNRLLGPHLRNIENKNGVPLKDKLIAITFLWASLSFSIYTVPLLSIRIGLALLGIAISIYILLILKTLKAQPTQKQCKNGARIT